MNAGAAGGSVTERARKGYLISALITTPIVALAIAAMVGRAVAAERLGDSQTAQRILISGAVVAVLSILVVIVFLLYLRHRGRVLRSRFALLEAAYPQGLACLVNYPVITYSDDSPDRLRAVDPRKIHAFAFVGGDLLLLAVDPTLRTLVRIEHTAVTAAVKTREIYRTEVTQVVLSVRSHEGTFTFGVLPSDVNQFALPSFKNLQALTEAIQRLQD